MGVSGKKIAGAGAVAAVCVVAGLLAIAVAGAGAAGTDAAGTAASGSRAREANWVLADRSASATASEGFGVDAGTAAGINAQTVYTADGAECAAGRVLLTFDGNMTEGELRENLAAAGVDVQDVTLVSAALDGNEVLVAVDYAGDELPDAVAASLAEQPFITGAEPDIMFELAEVDGVGTAGTGEALAGAGSEAEAGEAGDAAGSGNAGSAADAGGTEAGGTDAGTGANAAAPASADTGSASLAVTVNDPSYSEQWGFETVKATAAWDIVQASGQVTVATIDSGADCDHPDLADNLVTEYAKDVITGKTGAEAVEDTIGHGTHVAGIIAAVTDNGVGVAGISFNAKVLPVKATNENGKLPTTALVAALDYIVKCKTDADSPAELKNLRVVNMSLGYNTNPDSLRAAVQRAQDAGLLIVGAAGNKANSTPYYPAAYEGVVGVSACKQSADAEAGVEFDASYSNYGTYVDICAPGTNIYSTVKNGEYGTKKGTSMASPLVAGAAALLFARNTGIDSSTVEKLLEETALDLGDEGWDERYGYGLLDAQLAVASVPLQKEVSLEGDDRYDTADAIVREAYPEGASGVVVASGENFPDALAAAGLAGLLDYPVVITQAANLTAQTARLIEDLGATEAIIVGGEAAVSSAVESSLANMIGSGAVTRVWGADRTETAVALFEFGQERGMAGLCEAWGSTAIVASGTNYPDALSISGYAFQTNAPIFLVAYDESAGATCLTEHAKSALLSGGFDRVLITGGKQAVSDRVEKWLAFRIVEDDDDVERLAGDDRYETSREIAEFMMSEEGFSEGACIATGLNYPDAMVGGALAAKKASVMLLADRSRYDAFDALENRKNPVSTLYYLGGTSAVPNAVRAAAAKAAWS